MARITNIYSDPSGTVRNVDVTTNAKDQVVPLLQMENKAERNKLIRCAPRKQVKFL